MRLSEPGRGRNGHPPTPGWRRMAILSKRQKKTVGKAVKKTKKAVRRTTKTAVKATKAKAKRVAKATRKDRKKLGKHVKQAAAEVKAVVVDAVQA